MVTEGHLSGNGGTHYHLSIQAIIIHHILVVFINESIEIYSGNPFEVIKYYSAFTMYYI